jgi:predicted kinase
MARRAVVLLPAGGSVVANALFDGEVVRKHIERVATERDQPFVGIWLEVLSLALRSRIEQRKGGPSDTTVDVLSLQLAHDTGVIIWPRFDAAKAVDAIRGLLL